MKHTKRALALLLAVVMLITSQPVTAFAMTYAAGTVIETDEEEPSDEIAENATGYPAAGTVIDEDEDEEPAQWSAEESFDEMFSEENADEVYTNANGEKVGRFTLDEYGEVMTAGTSSTTRKAHFYVIWEPTLNDGANGTDFTILGGAQWNNSYPKTVVLLDSNGNETNQWSAGYCLNYGLELPDKEQSQVNYLTPAQQTIIGDIMAMGYQHSGGKEMDADSRYKWLITQILIWAACVGTIQYNTKTGVNEVTGRNGVKTDDDIIKQVGSLADYVGGGNYMNFYVYAEQLLRNVLTLRRRPSFTYATESEASKLNNAIRLTKDDSTGTYRAMVCFSDDSVKYDPTGIQFWNYGLKDNNFSSAFISQNYNFLDSGIEGLTVKYRADSTVMSGGKYGMEFNVTESFTGVKVSKKFTRTIIGGQNSCIIFSDGNSNTQNIAMFLSATDTINAYYSISTLSTPTDTTPSGIEKESEDGVVSGVQFGVSGSDGSYHVFTTDSDGKIDLSSLPAYEEEPVLDDDGNPVIDEETGEAVTKRGALILYTAQELNVPDHYVTPAPQSFTLANDSVTYTAAEALQAGYATLAVLSGVQDPIKLYADNAEFTQVSVKKNGTAYVKIQDSNGQKLRVCYAFRVTNGKQIFYGYTDENGILAMRDFDITSKNNNVDLIGYFQNGSFIAEDSYSEAEGNSTLNFNFDGTYFTPYEV